MATYRIVICVDLDAESLSEAYGKLHTFMTSAPEGIAWESSDEAFDPEGEEIDPEVLQSARMAFVDKRDECDECNRLIPRTGGSLANKHHAESCSLYDPSED